MLSGTSAPHSRRVAALTGPFQMMTSYFSRMLAAALVLSALIDKPIDRSSVSKLRAL